MTNTYKDAVDAAVSGVYGSYGGDAADVPIHIRPAETKASAEEIKAQSLYAERIESEADSITETGLARAHRDRATLARNSLPWAEYQDRLGLIRRAQSDAGSLSGADAIAIRGSYHDSAEKLTAAQLYNPMMRIILNAKNQGSGLTPPESYLPLHPDECDLAGCAAARVILGLDAEKGKARPLTQEQVNEMVQKEMDRQFAAETYLLRKDLAAFKAERGLK